MRDHTKLRAFELADELAIMIYRSGSSALRRNILSEAPPLEMSEILFKRTTPGIS